MEVHVTQVPWKTHGDRLRFVRERVFIDEQNVPREEEWDGRDEDAAHFIALNAAGQALGCARLLPDGQIGRMAVLESHRGTGLGMRLLEAAIDEAVQRGMRSVFLHAQTHALEFYRRAGFVPEGSEFAEAGIPHLAMTLALPVAFERVPDIPRASVRPEPARESAGPRGPLADTGEDACAAGLLAGISRARRHIQIVSSLLDPLLFERAEFVTAISGFVRGARSAQVRILLGDSSQIVARGHRLVELARRLDSRIAIRRLPPVGDSPESGEMSFVTWDDQGYWLLPDFREYQALHDFDDPVQAARLMERFERLWNRSAADPELRVLSL
jgi:predicted GNAT family N-acyltransferase